MNAEQMIAWAENNYATFNTTGPAFDPARTKCYTPWKLVTLYDVNGQFITQYDLG